tara:strand:+ start:40109 stop:40282 length:174 start_codon:yes stop_codon:yes gene_type:complete
MKLSEQIANTCCGVLADKQDMIDRALQMEAVLAKLIREDANYVRDVTGYNVEEILGE